MRTLAIDLNSVSCAPPTRGHLSRYHEAYIRENILQLPSLTWLCLAEISAFGGFTSIPHLLSVSEHRFKSFSEGASDLSRTDFSSCSRMDIEAFLYLSLYETQQSEKISENNQTILLPIALHKLRVLDVRCSFWTSLLTQDRAAHNPSLTIKDASKHKITVEKGLVSIRCLKKMELPTLIIYNLAQAFEHRLSNCTAGSPGFSEDRQMLLVARNELYWGETLRRLEMSEAGVSSLRADDSVSEYLATKLLTLQGKQAGEGLSEEKRKSIKTRADMVIADLALHRNHILKAISLYETLDVPQAAWNHAQLLKHLAISGNANILTGSQTRPPTAYDLLMRSHMILSEWTFKDEVTQDPPLMERFEDEIENLVKSIRDRKLTQSNAESSLNEFPEDESFKNLNDYYNSNDFSSGTFEQASAPPFAFPPQSAVPNSTSSPRHVPESSLSTEEQLTHMKMQFERLTLTLKQRDDAISDLSKKNVELKGIVQNLQYYFTDQKVLFKNPKDPENAVLRPEDLDNLPTPEIPYTVHNLSGRNLSISNNSPQYPFNNSSASNKSYNSTHKSFLDSSYPGDMNHGSLVSPRVIAPQSSRDFDFECDDFPQPSRQIISLKTKPQPQEPDQPAPFANLRLVNTFGASSGSKSQQTPFQLNFAPPPRVSNQSPPKPVSSLVRDEADTFVDELVGAGEHDPLGQSPLLKRYTGEVFEDVLFCKRGKLFKYKGGKWLEKGSGDMRVLKKHHEHKFRLLMLNELDLKMCSNHLILTSLEFKSQSDSNRSVTWSTEADFSAEGEPEPTTLAIRFKTSEIKEEFIKVVSNCKQTMKNSLLPNTSTSSVNTPPYVQTDPMGTNSPSSLKFGPQFDKPQTTDRPNKSPSDSDQDTEVLSNSDNETAQESKGPLKITSTSVEQTLFKEKAYLTVNQSQTISNFGKVQVRITGDTDRAEYLLLIHKFNSTDMLCKEEILSTIDLQPYKPQKCDKSWFLTVNQTDEPSKRAKFILRFASSPASTLFNQVIQDCIDKTKVGSNQENSGIKSGKEIPFSTGEYEAKSNTNSIFGMEPLQGFTFGSGQSHLLANSGISFGQLLAPAGPPVTPKTTKDYKEEQDTSQGDNSYEADAYFEPVVVLPVLTELKTGEEGEEIIFFQRTKLFRFINREWKERGLGELKILHNPSTGKYRIIMRRDIVKKLCCNHYITSEMTVKINAKNERTCNWFTTADFSEGTPEPEQLAAKFKTIEIATEFMEKFQKCVSDMKSPPAPALNPCPIKSDQKSTTEVKSKITDTSDDVIIVSVSEPTKDQVRRARELMLPDCFYLYENKPPCPGCRGCEEDTPAQSELGAETKVEEVNEPLYKTPPRDSFPARPGSIFGGNINFNLSFASLVPSQTSGFQTTSGSPFSNSIVKPVFSVDKEDEARSPTYEPDAHFKPVIDLPELREIKTGEESENILFNQRCALYRWGDKQWKERGKGEMKLLHNPDTGKYRLIMRRDVVKKLCCNHFITTHMKLKLIHGSNKTYTWHTLADSSEGSPQIEQLSARFNNTEIASQFKEVFEECQEEMMNRTLVSFVHIDSTSVAPDTTEDTDTPPVESETPLPGKDDDTSNQTDDSDDVIFIPPKEPTPEQIALVEQYKLPKYFYSYEDKPACTGCRGCDSDFEIEYEIDRPDLCQTTDDIVKELRDASEDESPTVVSSTESNVFGSLAGGIVSFTDLAQSGTVQGFSGQGNYFKSFARPLFGATEDGDESGEYGSDHNFEPIISLPEIQDLKTGEEDEEILFKSHAYLYRYVDKEWKEKGRGELKILLNNETGKHRLLMRRDQIKKLCCNHFITPDISLKPFERSANSWMWYTNADFSEEEHRPETLVVRFKHKDNSNLFKEIFDRASASKL